VLYLPLAHTLKINLNATSISAACLARTTSYSFVPSCHIHAAHLMKLATDNCSNSNNSNKSNSEHATQNRANILELNWIGKSKRWICWHLHLDSVLNLNFIWDFRLISEPTTSKTWRQVNSFLSFGHALCRLFIVGSTATWAAFNDPEYVEITTMVAIYISVSHMCRLNCHLSVTHLGLDIPTVFQLCSNCVPTVCSTCLWHIHWK